MFHHDMIHAEVPSKATLLYSVEIPSTGGNTLFASGYAAYDTLDPAIRDRLEGRKAVHHYNYGSPSAATAAAPWPSPNAPIRCFARTRTPAARRSMSTG
jgi:alpha-ketoglutarate-dependent taurine dioxygenase